MWILFETFFHMPFVFQTAEVIFGGQTQCDTDQSMTFSTNAVKCISDTLPVVSISYNSITHTKHISIQAETSFSLVNITNAQHHTTASYHTPKEITHRCLQKYHTYTQMRGNTAYWG